MAEMKEQHQNREKKVSDFDRDMVVGAKQLVWPTQLSLGFTENIQYS